MYARLKTSLLTLVTVAAVTVACGDDGPDADRYEAELNSANEVGNNQNNSTATGTATFTDLGGSIEYTLDVQGMSSPTAAHIHIGGPTVNGGVLVPLFSTTSPPATFSGRLASGTIIQSTIIGISMDSLRVLMRTNGAYVNVHTSANPGGEIRGQIVPR